MGGTGGKCTERGPMYKHVLIPTDGSELSIGAVRHGVAFAKDAGAEITFLTVTPPFNAFELGQMLPLRDPGEYTKHSEERAAEHLATAKKIAEAAGVSFETVHAEHRH